MFPQESCYCCECRGGWTLAKAKTCKVRLVIVTMRCGIKGHIPGCISYAFFLFFWRNIAKHNKHEGLRRRCFAYSLKDYVASERDLRASARFAWAIHHVSGRIPQMHGSDVRYVSAYWICEVHRAQTPRRRSQVCVIVATPFKQRGWRPDRSADPSCRSQLWTVQLVHGSRSSFNLSRLMR